MGIRAPSTVKTGNPNPNNLNVVAGGINQYGIARPDHLLMTNSNGDLGSKYQENIGPSAQTIRDYGNTMGGSIDPRASVGMGSSFAALRDRANAQGDMASIATMRQQAHNNTIRDLGASDANANTGFANAQAQMAMRGGIGAGASERMGATSMGNAMNARQGIIAQNRDQNLNLDLQNENMKNDLLKQVGGVEQANNQYNANAYSSLNSEKLNALNKASTTEQSINESNVGAMRGDLNNQNLAAYGRYKEDMAAYGATQSANAQRDSANSGGK